MSYPPPPFDQGGYQQGPGDHPPTAPFPQYDPAQHDPARYDPAQYDPARYDPAQYDPGLGAPPAPRRSNLPLVAVIVAVTMLLCGGTVFAGVLVVRNVVQTAKEAVPDLPTLPTALPTLPSDLPQLPGLPTELPDLPTAVPTLPGGAAPGGSGKTVTVRYQVDGDGPVDITYLDKGNAVQTVRNAKLPWRLEVSLSGLALASVIAMRTDATSGSVSCRATVDGAPAAERTRTGSYAVATCTKLLID